MKGYHANAERLRSEDKNLRILWVAPASGGFNSASRRIAAAGVRLTLIG